MGFKLVKKGKIRRLYEYDDDHYLLETTDGVSAFDVVLPTRIPTKGAVLARVSNFWMKMFSGEIPNHLTTIDPRDQIGTISDASYFQVIKKLQPLPVEAIVRGYLIGSGWKDYQKTGKVCGIKLAPGLQKAEKLPQPIYTPSTKADLGEHDENITFNDTVDLVGSELAHHIRSRSLAIFKRASEYAAEHGILIADTKFEFGVDSNGEIHIIDEVLTPDSSRFWDAKEYQVGISPPSFDKQIVRDYLETLDWDKTDPGPELPPEIVDRTAQRYQQVLRMLMSK